MAIKNYDSGERKRKGGKEKNRTKKICGCEGVDITSVLLSSELHLQAFLFDKYTFTKMVLVGFSLLLDCQFPHLFPAIVGRDSFSSPISPNIHYCGSRCGGGH